ncbi:MAG: PD-(D/E)XK nuclease family protein, partial [Chloroflexi bacterium]|nr:PD-(D/E)XK nuclease family protein [Chloroflexota bacterium]
VVSNYVVGRAVARFLARSGGVVNVRSMLLVDLAASLVGTEVERALILDDVVEGAAAHAAIGQSTGPVAALGAHLGTRRELVRLYRELRREEVDVEQAVRTASSPMAIAALGTYPVYRRLTSGYLDPTDLRDLATRRLLEGSPVPTSLREVGALVVFLPARLDPADVRLLAAAARYVSLRACFMDLPELDRDAPSELGMERLTEALGLSPPSVTTRSSIDCDLRVLHALDPAEEIREVVRDTAADLARGIPLYRCAILYRQADPYARLVRESLAAAGLPWFGLGGQTLADSHPGRLLVSVLRLPEREFSREAVLGWLDARPALAENGIPPSAWDRVSRAAGVVRGSDEWQRRLLMFAEQQEQDAADRPAELSASFRDFLRQQGALARRMSAVIQQLAAALEPPLDGTSWTGFAAWAEDVRQHLATPANGWPAGHEREAEAVTARLQQLSRTDRLATAGTTLREFVAALEVLLSNRSLPEGRLGDGVVVGPLESAAGLAFDHVAIVGLTEGSFPPTPTADPFFQNECDDPLARRARQRAAERESFLAAVSAADGGRLTLSAPDSLAGRIAFPSRWLLELAQTRLEPTAPLLDVSSFLGLSEDSHPWLRVVASPRDGVMRAPAPADLEDVRLRQAAVWCGSGRSLTEHPLAACADLPVGAGLRLAAARRSDRFTVYDGNLTRLAAESGRLRRLIDGTGVVSATGLEGWATCPFSYFMDRILRVDPTETPEDVWSIGALEKGRLIHGILQTFFRRLTDWRRPRRLGCSYAPADVAMLLDVAEAEFAEAEGRGLVGHPLAWEAAREQIRSDLLAFLTEDASWCEREQLEPSYFEQVFGTDEPDAWAAVEVPVGDQRLRFRGRIDRVDVSIEQPRAYVFDYKTGAAAGYRDLAQDPVLAGRKLQMAVYTRATRNHLGNEMSVGGAYWFVTNAGGFRQVPLPPDAEQVHDRLVQVVGQVASGIGSGTFPPVPGDPIRDSFVNCRYCPYDRVCSTSRDREWEHKQHDGCDCFTNLALIPQPVSAEAGAP